MSCSLMVTFTSIEVAARAGAAIAAMAGDAAATMGSRSSHSRNTICSTATKSNGTTTKRFAS